MFKISKRKTYFPKEHRGICVVRRDDETNEELIKRFRKKFSKSGLTKELRENIFYEKPSKKKRRKKMQAIRARKREQEKIEKNRIKLRKNKIKQKKKEKKND